MCADSVYPHESLVLQTKAKTLMYTDTFPPTAEGDNHWLWDRKKVKPQADVNILFRLYLLHEHWQSLTLSSSTCELQHLIGQAC